MLPYNIKNCPSGDYVCSQCYRVANGGKVRTYTGFKGYNCPVCDGRIIRASSKPQPKLGHKCLDCGQWGAIRCERCSGNTKVSRKAAKQQYSAAVKRVYTKQRSKAPVEMPAGMNVITFR